MAFMGLGYFLSMLDVIFTSWSPVSNPMAGSSQERTTFGGSEIRDPPPRPVERSSCPT